MMKCLFSAVGDTKKMGLDFKTLSKAMTCAQQGGVKPWKQMEVVTEGLRSYALKKETGHHGAK